MKKALSVLFVLSILVTACALPGGAPTPISLPTESPTEQPTDVPATDKPASGKLGDEKNSKSDGMIQVFIPEGTFNMGGYDADVQPDEQPTRQVTVAAFWMDKVEVTNAMYTLCVKDGACEPPNQLKSATQATYYNSTDFADYPVIYVTWNDADNYCKWAGRRLPTEAEWEYAARGSDFRVFPWGDNQPDDTLANFDYKLRDTARVGSFPAGASAFGVLDMSGNVWEWVSDFYSPNFYAIGTADNPTGPETAGANGLRMVVRGGSWADGYKELRLANRGFALAQNLSADKLADSYQGESNERTGFRCASVK